MTVRKSREATRTILVAGIGTSPAVLTETVWALAHQKKPVLPDEIVVFTTTKGKDDLKKAILSGKPSVWEQLKDALKDEKAKIAGKLVFSEHLIMEMLDADGHPMDDLRTGDDNLCAADFMLRKLRGYLDEPDTEVFCSIAGGRKTMSALIFSCMTLLGREQDKVYHVLIPPEFECGMEPPFYFPRKDVTHQLLSRGRPTGKKVLSTKIGIELFEVPFVRMRGWYQERFKAFPPSYRTLVSRVQGVAPPAVTYPEVEIDAWNCAVRVNGQELRQGKRQGLTEQEFALLILLANGISGLDELYRRLHRLNAEKETKWCQWVGQFVGYTKFKQCYDSDPKEAKQAVSDVMSTLRKKLTCFPGLESLVPMRGKPVSYPAHNIKWQNKKRLADICGYLFADVAK